MGNDLPSQGGISGNMPPPGSMGGLGNIFGPPKPSPYENMEFGAQNPLPRPTNNPMGPMGPGQRIDELYNPSHMAQDQFNELLGQYPNREEYKPGWLRSIGAAISAFGPGGYGAGMEFLNRPYTSKLEDWKNQMGPALQSANLERQENISNRTLAYQTATQERLAGVDAERARKNQADEEVRRQRANVYEFKARNPNVKFDFSGPTVMVADPATGKVSNTGISTGNLSDTDKMLLGQEHAMERIGATGEQARMTEGVRQTGREGLQETGAYDVVNVPDGQGGLKGVRINRVTGEVSDLNTGPVSRPLGQSTSRPEQPSQTKVRQYLAAKQLANSRPDLAKFIRFGQGTNEFSITPPSTGGFFSSAGPTPEQYAQLQQLIYGTDIPISQPGRTGTQPSAAQVQAPMTKTQTNTRTGEKRTLVSMDGGKTWQVQ